MKPAANKWLEQHLEEFVRPRLGCIPALDAKKSYYVEQVTETFLKAVRFTWAEVKKCAGDRPILLAGRDAYAWEILARCENYPTTFRPDISRNTVAYVNEDYSEHFLADTGYRGTIPIHLKVKNWKLISYTTHISTGKVTSDLEKAEHQLCFPNRNFMFCSGPMEGVEKYWTMANYRDGRIHQELEHEHSFINASMFTRAIATNKALK